MVTKAIDPLGVQTAMERQRPVFREALNPLDFIRHEPTDAPVRVPDVIPAPVRAGVTSRFSIDTVSDALN
jgi:hypothetical protein